MERRGKKTNVFLRATTEGLHADDDDEEGIADVRLSESHADDVSAAPTAGAVEPLALRHVHVFLSSFSRCCFADLYFVLSVCATQTRDVVRRASGFLAVHRGRLYIKRDHSRGVVRNTRKHIVAHLQSVACRPNYNSVTVNPEGREPCGEARLAPGGQAFEWRCGRG